jgi:hypothetical protein
LRGFCQRRCSEELLTAKIAKKAAKVAKKSIDPSVVFVMTA